MTARLRPVLSAWAVPLAAGLLTAGALGVYWLSIALIGRNHSPDAAYFNLLADSFLHGRLYLVRPPVNYDLTQSGGLWYVPFPPLPALLLMPWVALAGPDGVNTMLFGIAVGALNTLLAFALLQAFSRRGWTGLGLTGNIWLAVLWAFGSVHWFMSIQGSVWFLGQLCAAAFMLMAVWLATRFGSAWLAGGALALAMLARPNTALVWPLLLAIGVALADEGGLRAWRRWAPWAAQSLIPMALAAGLLLGYNYLRFKDPLDFGYKTENVNPDLRGDLRTYGQFNLRYVPHNLWALFMAGPDWNRDLRLPEPNLDGMSLFLTTPAVLYAFGARRRSPLTVGAWLAVGLLLAPLLTYYNTGWWQFGYRFSLDFMTPLLVLIAMGAGDRPTWPMRGLIVFGVLVNAWGAWWFDNPLYKGG